MDARSERWREHRKKVRSEIVDAAFHARFSYEVDALGGDKLRQFVAGGLIEEQQRTGRKFASLNERELADMLQRHGWELLGPSPVHRLSFFSSSPNRSSTRPTV